MAETNATILIPDISGFTEFMTTTELNHSSHAINMLIDAVVKAVGDDYEVSEIEGDAVLFIKKGAPPSKKEILDTCLKIFNDFHVLRMWIQQHAICPCGACQAIINLTLKFVAHHGPLAEIKVGRFIKQSGPEMIVAHRLLKNSISSNEYLLMTEKLNQRSMDSQEVAEMEWTPSSEEYASIGKVDYRYTLLNEARKKIPTPPPPDSNYSIDDTSYTEMSIEAEFRDVYMVVMNIPDRASWQPGLLKVEQDIPAAFVGSIHRCTFENYRTTVSPLKMVLSEEGIVYAESCKIEDTNISLVYEFVFKKAIDNTCAFGSRFVNAGESPLSEEMATTLSKKLSETAAALKEYCEKMEVSLFEPLTRNEGII